MKFVNVDRVILRILLHSIVKNVTINVIPVLILPPIVYHVKTKIKEILIITVTAYPDFGMVEMKPVKTVDICAKHAVMESVVIVVKYLILRE